MQNPLQDLAPASTEMPHGGLTDEEMLARIYLQNAAQPQRQSLTPNALLMLCGMGLAGLITIAAAFTAWLYRPVDQMAQAEALRSMSYAVTQSQAQIQEVIAEANPPSYHCVSLIGACNFPEQPQRQAPVLVRQELPESLGRAVAQPAVNEKAVATIRELDSRGYDESMIQQMIAGLYAEPIPGAPTPEEMALAYNEVYSDG